MSLDRIKQTVPVIGAGPIVLTADPSPGGYKPYIRALNAGDVVTICIVDRVTYDFEVTGATFALGGVGGTLTRNNTVSSSNGDAPVNFRGNACDVFVTHTAIANPTAAAVAEVFAALPLSPPAGGGLWNNGGVVSLA